MASKITEKLRSLDEICIENNLNWQITDFKKRYCRLSHNGRRIQCKYIGKKEPNNLRACKFLPVESPSNYLS